MPTCWNIIKTHRSIKKNENSAFRVCVTTLTRRKRFFWRSNSFYYIHNLSVEQNSHAFVIFLRFNFFQGPHTAAPRRDKNEKVFKTPPKKKDFTPRLWDNFLNNMTCDASYNHNDEHRVCIFGLRLMLAWQPAKK
jgi:hypothetical protein